MSFQMWRASTAKRISPRCQEQSGLCCLCKRDPLRFLCDDLMILMIYDKVYLVMLEAMQQDIQVEGRDVVADVDIGVQRAQARQQISQQSALRALRAEHGAAVAPAHVAAVCRLHHALKACIQPSRLRLAMLKRAQVGEADSSQRYLRSLKSGPQNLTPAGELLYSPEDASCLMSISITKDFRQADMLDRIDCPGAQLHDLRLCLLKDGSTQTSDSSHAAG